MRPRESRFVAHTPQVCPHLHAGLKTTGSGSTGDRRHGDQLFRDNPESSGSILSAQIAHSTRDPELGGQTQWASSLVPESRGPRTRTEATFFGWHRARIA